jgi:O-antigen biosynthesis protein
MSELREEVEVVERTDSVSLSGTPPGAPMTAHPSIRSESRSGVDERSVHPPAPSPHHSGHRTSIVLVVDSDLEATRECVAAIRKSMEPGSYELSAVCLDPGEAVTTWLEQQDGLALVSRTGPLSATEARNLGIAGAHQDDVLLLSTRVRVPPDFLPAMLAALHSDPSVGAVGPVMDGVPGQTDPVAGPVEPPSGLDSGPSPCWDRRLRLSDECLLVKREALDTVGGFDPRFSRSTFEDDDFSFRLITAGWTLLCARNVAVPHAGRPPGVGAEDLVEQRKRFVAAWGFDPTYSAIQRSEIVALLDGHDPDTRLRVLEIGCACGATLLEIKNRYPNAEIHGIELNQGAVAIGRHFADIRPMDAEEPLDFPEEFFDYVITADVLEHLVDPWRAIANIRPHLKGTGRVIASIPNIMHFSVMRGLLNGRFPYQEAGILDRTHLRFFTLSEIDRLFVGAGYGPRHYLASTIPASEEDRALVQALKSLSTVDTSDQFQAYQYLVTVGK